MDMGIDMPDHCFPVFERLEESTSLKCQACSAYLTYDKIIKPRTKSNHLTSQTHQRALEVWGQETNSPLDVICSSRSGVYLSAAAQFGESNPDSEEEYIPEFQDLVVADDGVYQNNTRIMLSAGVSIDDGATEALEQINHLLQGNLEAVPSTHHEPSMYQVLEDLWIEDEDNGQFYKETDKGEGEYTPEEDCKWFPYENKTLFFLDLLDSLPRLRMSDDQMKAILWVMKECGTQDVPSFYKLRKAQEKLRGKFLTSREHVSISGKRFFANDPVEIIRLVSS